MTNEILFYGGLAISGISALAAVTCLVCSIMGKTRLEARLDEEYGKRSDVKAEKRKIGDDCLCQR